MTLYKADVISVNVHSGDETAFGVAEGSFSGRDVQLSGPPTVLVDQEAIPDPTQVQNSFPAYAPRLGLKNKTKLSLPFPLRGTGTAAVNATAAKGYADLSEGQFLRNIFGEGESLGTGTTVNDESSAVSEFDVASAAGLSIGQAVLVTASAVLEASPIGNIATSTLTLLRAVAGAPENSSVVHASATYYVLPGEVGHSLQFRVMDATGDSWDLLGCQLHNAKLGNLNPGNALPHVSVESLVASWAVGAVSATVDSYDNATLESLPGYASKAYLQDFGTVARNQIDPSSISVDLGIAIEPRPSASGVQGIASYFLATCKPVVELVVPYSDAYRDDFEARQAYYFHYQIGATAGQTVLIELVKCYQAKKPEPVAVGGIKCHKLTLMGVTNTAGTTDLTRSPIKLHLL